MYRKKLLLFGNVDGLTDRDFQEHGQLDSIFILSKGGIFLKGKGDVLQVEIENGFFSLEGYCAHRGPFWVLN